MANLLTRLLSPSDDIARYSLSEYVRKRVEAIENNPFAFSYSTPTASYRGRYVEKVEDSYASLASYAYRGDSVVAACMRVRRDLFRQAKFCWREIDEAGPGKIFRTDELDLLDNPWPNGTTGELLARMITDIDLCGNSFIHHDGDRLRWLRPDWVSIVLSGDPQADPDIDVLGYVYTPGGLDPEKNGVGYKPDEICHWAPEQDPLAFYRGMSWVSKALEEVQGDRAATTHKVAFFRNGATLGPIVRVPAGTTMAQFKEFMAAAEEAHAGAHNAYKTMYLGGGAEVTLAAADFRQLDLKSVQGGMETRIAAVAGVHPVLVGLSEGLAGSSLNSGNFAAARRATAEMTLYSLWQDACGALQAFFKVPDQAELWIRERDIPFLREEARDRAEIFKTQVLAIEAAMRAGFKPDPAVQATLEERLDLLIGNHTGLFSVQMQPPQSGMPGAPPLDVNGDGQPDEPGAPIDFGALRAGAWWFDPEDIERGVEVMFDGVELDDVLERSYNPEQARIPKGFEGGGRFRKLSDRLVALLNDWAKGEGDDDPLDEYSRDQLRRVAKELADKARADGDNERAARLTPRRGASSDEIKLALYKDVRAHVRGERDRKADEPKRQAKFTLQSGEFRDKDVAVYRLPGDKPALFYESDAGRRGGLVERFDDLDGLEKWADEHGETRLAEWARKEAGRGVPEAKPAARSLADVAAAVRRMGDEDDIAAKIKDVRATDVRALADELNLTLPPAAKSATARKRYIAQTMAGHHRRTGGRFEHIGPLGRTTAEEDRVITDALEEGRDAREALREFRARRGASPTADAPHPREQAARDRQARYDRQRSVAKPLAHTLAALDMEASDRALRNRIEGQAKVAGTPDEVRDRLLSAVGDRDRLRETVRDLEREHGLTRIGDTDAVVPFDGMAHESISPDVRKGQQVTVLRPGYYVQDDSGRRVVLESAQVQDQGPYDVPGTDLTVGDPSALSNDEDSSDPEALRDALDLRKVDELKAMLRERGLPVSGRKRELVDRLVDAPSAAGVAETTGAKARGDNSAIVGALRGGGSEGEYIRALAADPSLTSTRLRAVAADLGIDVPADMRAKTALQLHIASEAARKFGPGDGSLADRMPTPGASKAFDAASMAERLTRLNDEGQDFSAELKGVTSIANARKLATALNISAPSTPHPTRKDFFGTAIKAPKKMTLAEWRKYIAEQLGRSALRSGPPEAEDLIRAGEVDVEDLEDEDYDDEPDLEDMQAMAAMDAEVERAAGHDVTPGHDELHHYWTRGEGLAKWADSPRPWTTLVAHLVKHVGERKARIFASRWFIEVFGFAAGSDMNRVTHGKPPRGQVVGPG